MLAPCIRSTAVAALLFAAVATLDVQAAYTVSPGPSFDVWQVEDGLPQSTVQSIVQTRDGYLWLGTHEGLVRFDGQGFTIFDVRSTGGGLGSNHVWTLFEDSRGDLWIGTAGGGLTRHRHGRFERFDVERGLSHDMVSSIAEDNEGRLWVGTYGGGLNRFDGEVFLSVREADGLPSDLVRAVVVGGDGLMWVGTAGGGLARLGAGTVRTWTTQDGLSHDTVNALLPTDDGAVWVGTGAGLDRLDGDGVARIEPEVLGGAVHSIWDDGAGDLWVGTGGEGLLRIRDDGATSFGRAEGLSNAIVYAIHGDREGSLWFGTGGGGLNRLRRGAFRTLTTRGGLTDDMVSSIFESSDVTLWIGTWGAGLNRFDSRGHRAYTVADGLSSDFITAVFEDREGTLWVGTYDAGLNRLSGDRIRPYSTGEGLAHETVWAVAEDRRGTLWVGTSEGLARLAPGAARFVRQDGLPHNMVRALHLDRRGALWVGTNGGGLVIIRDGAIEAVHDAADGLSGEIVYAFHEDADGAMWVGTNGGGLTRIRDGEFRAFTSSDGLCHDAVFRILEDRGDLWLSSNKGISRVATKMLDAFARGEIDRIPCRSYGRGAGMVGGECNGGFQPAGWRARDGRLWFPTIAGAVAIDPGAATDPEPPPTLIETVLVNQEPVGAAEATDLRPGRGDLEFHYTAPSFLDAANLRFRYRLEGYDDGWLDAGSRRAAYYTNLPPGAYRFRVAAGHDDGSWSEDGAVFDIHLRPRFYQTAGFRVGVVLAAVLAVCGLYFLRVRRLKARERLLARQVELRTAELLEATRDLEAANKRQSDLVSGVTHELRTPLTLIQLYAETLLADPECPRGDVESHCRIITRESERLGLLVDRVLGFSRLQRGMKSYELVRADLGPVVERTLETYGRYLRSLGFDVRSRIDDAMPPVRIDPEAVSEALLNLLDNAAKYSGESKTIRVDVVHRGDDVLLDVTDHGVGIPSDERVRVFEQFHRVGSASGKGGYGLGLYLVRHIMEAHGGRVELDSAVGRGSRFRLVFPAVVPGVTAQAG